MPIIKNEPIFTPGPEDYSKPRHVIVKGTYEDIGFSLAELAKESYGVTKLAKYKDEVYAAAHKEYFKRNWSNMLGMRKGVLRAFGLPEDDNEHDATMLPYDLVDLDPSCNMDHAMDFTFCSAVVLPKEKSANDGVFISRNFDLFALVVWTGLFGQPKRPEEENCWARGFVMEKRPTDGGYRSLSFGGMDVLMPYTDGMNEKGLYYTLLSDPYAVGKEGSAPSGGALNGISFIQLGPMLLEKCATVKEAKTEILSHRVLFRFLTGHMLLADATGDATIFEINSGSQEYRFTDRKVNDPLFITNHPVSTYTDPSTYPEYPEDAEHNTFYRMNLLNKTYDGMKGPFEEKDAKHLTDVVHCAFVDDHKAQAGTKERTLYNITADLSVPEIKIRYYLSDVGPIEGTNHMKDRMTKYYTFGFD